MKKLQPFGDVPKKLTEQLRRSFVATRTFAQALMQGKHVVNKILKVRETQGRARPVHDIQVPCYLSIHVVSTTGHEKMVCKM